MLQKQLESLWLIAKHSQLISQEKIKCIYDLLNAALKWYSLCKGADTLLMILMPHGVLFTENMKHWQLAYLDLILSFH
jgi:hypothetical protein